MYIHVLNLCHNKYRITGGMSHIAIEDPNLLELCALERKFIVQCARIPKILTLCSLSNTLHPPMAFIDYREVRR